MNSLDFLTDYIQFCLNRIQHLVLVLSNMGSLQRVMLFAPYYIDFKLMKSLISLYLPFQ